MKVLLVNGSSKNNGCTSVALSEVARALREEGIETETVFLGNQPFPDCTGCRKCREIGSAYSTI
ncbi:NADPH-dependent FMN reductase [uncultured Ruminococcus sp.]|nr:NADPH-dependent FMN reductase [uncultured Ruminococcus sp.]